MAGPFSQTAPGTGLVIDRSSRDRLTILLRDLQEGSVDGSEFRASSFRSNDLAVREIAEQAWLLFRDLPEPNVPGRRKVLRDLRAEVGRWILFLGSEREYEWPALSATARVLGFIPSLLTFGLFWAPYRWWFKRRGDYRVWPFLDEAQLQETQAENARRKRA